MKLTALLGALFFASTPAFADDLTYLKCNGTVQFKAIDKTEKKVFEEREEEVVIYYEIDLKKKLLTASNDPEVPSSVKISNGIIVEEIEVLEQGTKTGNISTEIEYAPPGKITGIMTASEKDESVAFRGELSGSCEASDVAAYEASK